MTINNSAEFFLNFQQFGDMKLQAREGSSEATNDVARQFEGLFVQQMLAAMRSASKFDSGQHSSYMDTYLDMYDKQLAQSIAGQGRLGVAKLILNQLPSANPVESLSEVNLAVQLPSIKSTSAAESTLPLGVPKTGPAQITSLTDATSNRAIVSKVVDDDFAEVGGVERTSHQWQNPQQFVADIWPDAQAAATKLGISARLLVAQAALETGWGQHMIRFDDGRSSNNLFGIKAGSQWSGNFLARASLEFQEGALQNQVSRFRAYDSPAHSITDYVDFIRSNPRYHQALAEVGNEEAYIREIHRAGYATDPDYADKVIKIMNGQLLRQSVVALDTGVNQHA